jgi:hypothetical protein
MNKKARLLCLSLAAAVIAGLAGCTHKPAYSEMDANRMSRNQNQNSNQSAEGQTAASTPAPAEPAATEKPQPAPAPPPAAFKSPSFLDPVKGEIKDLPAYPHAQKVSSQIGPMQGVNTMSVALTTPDPMNKIATFFERVIKDNKWTVIDKIIDPEFSEWNLKKGEGDTAKVQVKQNQSTCITCRGTWIIVMVRGEKLEGPNT